MLSSLIVETDEKRLLDRLSEETEAIPLKY